MTGDRRARSGDDAEESDADGGDGSDRGDESEDGADWADRAFDHEVLDDRARGLYVEVTDGDRSGRFFYDDGDVSPESRMVARDHGQEWVDRAVEFLESRWIDPAPPDGDDESDGADLVERSDAETALGALVYSRHDVPRNQTADRVLAVGVLVAVVGVAVRAVGTPELWRAGTGLVGLGALATSLYFGNWSEYAADRRLLRIPRERRRGLGLNQQRDYIPLGPRAYQLLGLCGLAVGLLLVVVALSPR